jgi:hypothetical protein
MPSSLTPSASRRNSARCSGVSVLEVSGVMLAARRKRSFFEPK